MRPTHQKLISDHMCNGAFRSEKKYYNLKNLDPTTPSPIRKQPTQYENVFTKKLIINIFCKFFIL